MYLKSLEMQGFKSFPDKTVLMFNKGITAVVGPNGSGKSNISDAMRWVMGEQSSKALRGEKMAGVIFHGCSTRKESPFAQVTLTIDNEDRALAQDSDVVSVSRKLYKNGDSEYMINGNSVRLKEVNELFMDTGLGKDGYSIVGQGRIADIVNGKGSDRREILEEAAGIAKFRYKKYEAEKKLADAEDNIARLNDIIAELESRIGPLEKQCEKAKKFKVLDDEKRTLEISVWVYRLEQYRTKLAEYEEKIRLVSEQHKALSEELAASEKEIDEKLRASAKKLAEADDFKQKMHDTEMDSRKAEADIAVCENDITHIEENIQRLNDEAERARADKYFLESELKKQKEQLEELNKRKTEAEAEVTAKEKEFDRLISDTEESDKEIGKVNSEISAAYLEKSRLGFRKESAQGEIKTCGEELAENESGRSSTEKELKLAKSDLDKLKKDKEKAEDKRTECNNRMGGMGKLLEKKQEKLERTNSELTDIQMKLSEAVSRLQILKDLEKSMEGFGFSVKHILTAHKQGRINGVCGTVAQLIDVKPEYSVAVETALGGALQNIVTENEDSAKRGIRLLKESNKGRATFLPLTSVKGSRLDVKGLEDEDGFVSLGCDIVGYDKRYEGVIAQLLGRVCIAEDIDSASRIAKKYGYKFRIVTLDGQVVNAGGSYTGGSVSKSTGILTRKNEINDLEAAKTKFEGQRDTLSAEHEKLKNEADKLSAEMEGLKETLSQAENTCLRVELEIKRVDEFIGQYNKTLDESSAKEEKLKERIAAAEKELEEVSTALEAVDKKIFEQEAALSQSQSQQDELKAKRQSLTDELAAKRIRNAELVKDIQACRESIVQLENSIESNSGGSGKTEQEIAAERDKIEEKRKEIERIKQRIEDSKGIIEKLGEQAEQAQKEHFDLGNEAEKIRSAQRNKLNEKENLAEQLIRGEERKNAVSNDFDKLAAQLWDEYELTRSTAAEVAQELEDTQAAEKRLTELKNQIKALGNVNLAAIEEYKEVSERYTFMTGQLNDVNVSKAELCGLIEELTEKMRSVFMQSFDAINGNFKHIFAELFGGGRGELILTDPENVLECGIEINVQPPGKVITSLMSLSGGEQSLAAIALYFAILKNSPSPFCLLDEIEAALDDVNVTRYAQYLHRLTDNTQFITITHRRGTMEEADILYGVTMQEKGISKLLKMSAAQTGQMSL